MKKNKEGNKNAAIELALKRFEAMTVLFENKSDEMLPNLVKDVQQAWGSVLKEMGLSPAVEKRPLGKNKTSPLSPRQPGDITIVDFKGFVIENRFWLIGIFGVLAVIVAVNCAWVILYENKHGLQATYFPNINLQNPEVVRRVDDVNYNFGPRAPTSRFKTTQYSIRFEGNIKITESGPYQFSTFSDDGARLWINNALVVDDWRDHGATMTTNTLSLEEGIYPLRLEYYNNAAEGLIKLYYQKPSDTKMSIIPMSVLLVGKPID